jgi:hypothetical protein
VADTCCYLLLHLDSPPFHSPLPTPAAFDCVDFPPPLLQHYGRESKAVSVTEQDVEEGNAWPAVAHTMIGMKRLDNLHSVVDDVLRNNVPGDFVETGDGC